MDFWFTYIRKYSERNCIASRLIQLHWNENIPTEMRALNCEIVTETSHLLKIYGNIVLTCILSTYSFLEEDWILSWPDSEKFGSAFRSRFERVLRRNRLSYCFCFFSYILTVRGVLGDSVYLSKNSISMTILKMLLIIILGILNTRK